MSPHDEAPPPMDEDLRALLRGTKTSFDAEASLRIERAFDRISRALPDVGTPPDGDPSPPSNVEDAVGVRAGSAVAKLGLTKLAAPIFASVLTGSLIGAAVTYVAMPVRERVVYVDRPVVSTPAPPSSLPPSVRVEDLPKTPEAVPTAAVRAPSNVDVSAERLLLDAARTAFASGDYARSLDRLGQHEARFPSGVLSEEREALAIRALAASGDEAAATKRARLFVTKYPESIMRPAVEAAAGAP